MSIDCRVCHEPYTTTGLHIPRLLSCCGHSVCDACVQGLLLAQRRHGDSSVDQYEQNLTYYYGAHPQQIMTTIDCPFDRVTSPLVCENNDGVYTLRKNYALIEMLERCAMVTRNDNAQQSSSSSHQSNQATVIVEVVHKHTQSEETQH
jgi:hypothetical protein